MAVGAPYDGKDALRARGYRWDPGERAWWREVMEGNESGELEWLASQVYRGAGQPRLAWITAEQRYAASN